MAFKITKAEREYIDSELVKLASERQDLDKAIAEFNEIVQPAVEKLNGAIQTYNQAKVDAGAAITEVRDRLQGEWDDKSERWQESDRGSDTQGWISTIETVGYEFDNEIAEFELPEFDIGDEPDFEDYVGGELSDEPEFY